MRRLNFIAIRMMMNIFFANVSGNEEDVAQMIFAYLTYKPSVLKKVFKKILDEIYRGNNNE